MSKEIFATYIPQFKSVYKELSSQDQDAVDEAIAGVVSYRQTGSAPHGLRIKQLRSKIYEARVDIHTRLVFFADKNIVRFLALGNHDDVVRALKQI